jgi:dienelactone hydrolase
MKRFAFVLLGLALSACASTAVPTEQAAKPPAFQMANPLPANVTVSEANWYSEQVRVSGRLFQPAGPANGAARPAVVLAPGWGETAETLDAYAGELAAQGIVALAADYRGWGRSGAYLYLGEPLAMYDKMRFSEQTPELVFRRGRLDPEQQVQDLRNAITFLQSLPGVDRAKIGILGVDMGGGHVISVMSMDTRARVGVAVTPLIYGKGEDEKSFMPDATTQAELIRLAREGAPPKTEAAARARNKQEERLALREYKPFWRLDAVPQTAAVRFIIAETDDEIDNIVHARTAARELKGPNDVTSLPGALHKLTPAQTEEAARLAAEWFKQRL